MTIIDTELPLPDLEGGFTIGCPSPGSDFTERIVDDLVVSVLGAAPALGRQVTPSIVRIAAT